MSLSRSFCVYLHLTPWFKLWRKHAWTSQATKQVFVKYKIRNLSKAFLNGQSFAIREKNNL